jgi:transposase
MLTAQVSELIKIVSALQEEIRLLRNGKNSGTSNTPPSHQIGRSNTQNFRVKTNRKPGGQSGHEGNTLKMKEFADKTIDHIPQYCHDCGFDLGQATAIFKVSRQEVIIPPVQALYVEHRSYSKVCAHCGKVCTGAMPTHLKGPIQYGAGIEVLVSYLSVYQHMPYYRITVLLKDLFSLPISEGTVDNMLKRTAQKALPLYDNIRERLQQSHVVGSDETGSRFGGKKGWFHVWQTTGLTFIVASMNRGYQTIKEYFADGFPLTVYVSDCWAAQLKVTALAHQLCIAHLLRELRNFEDALACQWSSAMKQLLQDAIVLKKQMQPQDYLTPTGAVTTLEQRLSVLLQIDHRTSHKKVQAFVKRLKKNRNSVFTFLHHPKVPPDNNGSERAVRNVKVKTKISSLFRTEKGAKRFAIIRSVIDTTIKNTNSVFDALSLLANLQPE